MNNDAFAAGAGLAGILMIVLIACAILLLPAIFYMLTLQKALNRCAPENRAMAPGLVWLLLVPLVSIVWHFFVVLNVAKSLGAEFQKRGIAEETNPGQKLGLIMCIVFCCGIIPIVNLLAVPAGLICWILYWVKIAGFSKKLAS